MLEVLGLIVKLVPVATSLIEQLSAAGVNTGPASDVAALIAGLTPTVATLVTTIEQIRAQTETQYPEVWSGIRTDWMVTLAKWNNLQGV